MAGGTTVIGNRDGKFVERFIPALISAAIAVVGMAIVFWADTRANTRETTAAIARLDKEMSEIKRAAEIDRQKTTELSADVKVILAIMQRVERKVDQQR